MKFRSKKRSPLKQTASKNVPANNYYRPVLSPKTINLENSSESKSKKLSLSRVVNFLLILGIFGLVVYSTTLSPTPNIQLKKNNIQYYESAQYQQAAKEIMDDSLLNKSKLLFQSSIFESKMREEFPEISQIAAIVPLGGRDLTVVISVSDPFAVVSNGSKKGILNSEGVLVSTNSLQSSDEGLVKIRFATPQENFNIGSKVLTESEVALVSSLNRELLTITLKDGSKLEIDEVLFNVSNGQLEVKLKDKQYYIKLSSYSDTDLQVGAVKATLKQLDRDNALPAKYLDVRVPNRVFVN